ncbi:adenosine receptor A3-like [Ambystoma mexicanum]|uniref:adenosine receptor A3-like n=1 Tax=Ambystoma mexicanum TaxID=8296 RepID=UPI0037E9B2C8
MANDTVSLTHLQAVYITIESIIAVFAVIGNVLVIWAVMLMPGFQNTTFYFIVSLSVADVAVGFLVTPLAIVVSLQVQIHFYACLFMCCLLIIFTHVSIMSLLAIAIDRYLRIKIPTRYRFVVTQRRIWLAVGVCWLVSSLMGLLPMFGWNQQRRLALEGRDSHYVACAFTSVVSMDFMVYFSSFGWILIPLILMFILYTEIFYRIRQLLNQNVSNSKDNSKYYNKEKKTAQSLALVLLLFSLCWLPLCIMNCMLFFCRRCQIAEAVAYLAILLSHSNSVMNPIVYAFKIETFKVTYVHIVKTYILRDRQAGHESDLQSQTTSTQHEEGFQ